MRPAVRWLSGGPRVPGTPALTSATSVLNSTILDPDLRVPCRLARHEGILPTATPARAPVDVLELDPASPLLSVRRGVMQRAVGELKNAHLLDQVPLFVSPHPSAPVYKKRPPPSAGKHATAAAAPAFDGLARVRHVVAVASGKGGVGKSTVAVNLAGQFARMGARVGLFDADVHGPSMPTMVVPRAGGRWTVNKDPKTGSVSPIVVQNGEISFKCMSYGFVGPGTKGKGSRELDSTVSSLGRGPSAAMMRGPMASRTAEELASKTEWGELDVLIVDLPPGTGDVHLALGQRLEFDAAVVVTTPQELSFVDVARGVDMLESLKVPVVALVENMGYFVCDSCDKKHRPFGPSRLERLAAAYGVECALTLPMQARISAAGDEGLPLTMREVKPSENAAQTSEDSMEVVFERLVRVVSSEMVRNAVFGRAMRPVVTYDAKSGRILARFTENDAAIQYALNPLELRKRLRAVDEMLGLKLDDLAPDVHPVSVEPKGNYAVAIQWSDGHDASIYTHEAVRRVAREVEAEEKAKQRAAERGV